MLEHMYKAIGQALKSDKHAGHAKKKKMMAAKGHAAIRMPIKTAKFQKAATYVVTTDGKTVRLVTPEHGKAIKLTAVSGQRRAAALKLMKVEKDLDKFQAVEKDLERAKRIAELRAQALKLQVEIEQLRRQIEK